jgi:hypothetical protein
MADEADLDVEYVQTTTTPGDLKTKVANADVYRIVKSGPKKIKKGPFRMGMMGSGHVGRYLLPLSSTRSLGLERSQIFIRLKRLEHVLHPTLLAGC